MRLFLPKIETAIQHHNVNTRFCYFCCSLKATTLLQPVVQSVNVTFMDQVTYSVTSLVYVNVMRMLWEINVIDVKATSLVSHMLHAKV